ncbi:MAG: hypothetical protein H7328_09165 [Bdellovibrio sp.]|nr:hypothetical protein [Bdellovibrio sp.]
MKSVIKVNLLFAFLFLFAGCSAIKNSQYEQYLSLESEITECLTSFTYASPNYINGTATFYKRGLNLVVQSGELKNMFQGNPLATPLPIRFAEVAVYDGSNKLVQCGKTDVTGRLKALDGISNLIIPATAGNYTVRVLARTHKTLTFGGKLPFEMFLAVKEDIYTNKVHYVSGTSYSNGVDGITNLDIKAFARQTQDLAIRGGAFNALNTIQTAYEFIQNNTGPVTTTCLNSKLNVYWKAGFNPGQYLEPSTNPANVTSNSYYVNGEKNLFITGGKLGNVSIETAHHFDDFVIIHELGHFIEAQCGQLTSPGGSHSIIARIDPRLAWTEGWANYFAGQVMNAKISSLNPELIPKLAAEGLPSSWKYFFASKGFTDSFQGITNGTGFMFDMSKPGNNPDIWQIGAFEGFLFDPVDPPRYLGEGHFREGAITRGLFKLTNTCGANCMSASPISFQNIWKSMDRITGAGKSIYTFKDSHRVLEILKNFITVGNTVPANWTPYKTVNQATTSEALQLFSDGLYTTGAGVSAINRWTPYGTFLTTKLAGSCANGLNYIEPRTDDPVLTSTNSDQRYSNQYFTFDPAILTGITQLNFTFTKVNGSGSNVEFDILLYGAGYFHAPDYTCTAYNANAECVGSWAPTRTVASDMLRSDRRAGALATKTIRTLNLLDPTQRYLIDVRAYTANRSIATVTDYSYTITDQNGLSICP